MSGIAKACLLLGGLFALAALAWMAFLPAIVEGELRAATGFDFRITVLAANPFTGRVVVRGLAARNPPAYLSPDFVVLRELRADVDVFSWVFTDRYGRCIGLGAQLDPVNDPWTQMTVDRCTFGPEQKWNAPATAQAAALNNFKELN